MLVVEINLESLRRIGGEPSSLQIRQQTFVQRLDLLAAARAGLQGGHRLFSIVEIIEIFVEPHALAAHYIALEYALGRAIEEAVIRQRLGQHVAAVEHGARGEGEMIEPEEIGRDRLIGHAEPFGESTLRAIGAVADADAARKSRIVQSLGHQSCRIGEIEQPGIGTIFGHLTCVIENGRDGAQSHGKAARPRRLLAQDADIERDALVAYAPFDAAGANGGDDKIGASQRFGTARGGGDADLAALLAGDLGRQRPEGPQSALRQVHKAEFFETKGLRPAQRRLDKQGRPYAAAADQSKFHRPASTFYIWI